MKKLAVLAFAFSGWSVAAQAETMLPTIADTDGSGAWSLEELRALWPDMTDETFVDVDSNADGSVDAAELSAAIEAGKLVPPAQ